MEQLRDPLFAAVVAAMVTAGYIYLKARMNNEAKVTTSSFIKPAVLNGILVYFIVSNGMAQKARILTEPY